MALDKFKQLVLTALCIAAISLQAESKPNILIVLLDDFGTGHFAPVARQLNVIDVDPAFLEYTASLEETYDPKVALEASRRSPLARIAF